LYAQRVNLFGIMVVCACCLLPATCTLYHDV
jgi:hypothetical protein